MSKKKAPGPWLKEAKEAARFFASLRMTLQEVHALPFFLNFVQSGKALLIK